MVNLEDDLNEMFGLGIKKVQSRPIVREKTLPTKESKVSILPSKPSEKIKTDRDLNKEGLLSRIVNILSKEKDSIPIEVFRGFDLFFRVIKERGKS